MLQFFNIIYVFGLYVTFDICADTKKNASVNPWDNYSSQLIYSWQRFTPCILREHRLCWYHPQSCCSTTCINKDPVDVIRKAVAPQLTSTKTLLMSSAKLLLHNLHTSPKTLLMSFAKLLPYNLSRKTLLMSSVVLLPCNLHQQRLCWCYP